MVTLANELIKKVANTLYVNLLLLRLFPSNIKIFLMKLTFLGDHSDKIWFLMQVINY